ncbi:hypothetical protein BDP55DRAFT_642242 [Colletotrichum godetiae]|uniref:Uncharacterized protein n=1 Tax=Colletotrichum godetiae TaxID=1209918 RepID=A0AAJ0AXR5_9PEZI|nr:uncharacterized protein BDP55DRAFT_642242 [Colletotrichum godetiae]KAK1700254.1 hypothetical protein BDP55DRAFT_642242 [Colletotrichum godetiae]
MVALVPLLSPGKLSQMSRRIRQNAMRDRLSKRGGSITRLEYADFVPFEADTKRYGLVRLNLRRRGEFEWFEMSE